MNLKPKALVAFKSKFFNPCRKIFIFFKLNLKKPLLIRTLRRPTTPNSHHTKPIKTPAHHRISNIFCFNRHSRSKDMDRVRELKGVPTISDLHPGQRVTFPSPLTPTYDRFRRKDKRQASVDEDVEDACRSFENYLVQMIVEEGKTKDLMDVEELLYCWKNLKSPVFIDLVCTFYGELCKDLFSTDHHHDSDSPK